MDETKILPCPYCGSEAVMAGGDDSYFDEPFRVECTANNFGDGDPNACGAVGRAFYDSDGEQKAFDSWNQVAALLSEVERLRKEREWIPVTERLPEEQGHFLVWAPLSFPKNTEHVVAEFYDDNNMFYSESSDAPMPDVTHWQPIPSPPDTKGGAA